MGQSREAPPGLEGNTSERGGGDDQLEDRSGRDPLEKPRSVFRLAVRGMRSIGASIDRRFHPPSPLHASALFVGLSLKVRLDAVTADRIDLNPLQAGTSSFDGRKDVTKDARDIGGNMQLAAWKERVREDTEEFRGVDPARGVLSLPPGIGEIEVSPAQAPCREPEVEKRPDVVVLDSRILDAGAAEPVRDESHEAIFDLDAEEILSGASASRFQEPLPLPAADLEVEWRPRRKELLGVKTRSLGPLQNQLWTQGSGVDLQRRPHGGP